MQLPFASQSYIAKPSLRVAITVTLVPVAVAVPTAIVASQLLSAVAVLSAGQLSVVELPAGVTVTVKLQLSPAPVAVTTVVPCGKKQSLQWLVVTTPHSSLPLGGEKCTTDPGLFGLLGSVVLAGVMMSSGQATVHVFVPPVLAATTLAVALEELSSGLSSLVALEIVTVLVIIVPVGVVAFTL